MLGTLTPLRAGKALQAERSTLKIRNIEVTGTAIILRDDASSYSIDLSGKSGGSIAYTLDATQTHRAKHEAAGFEIILIMPAENPPAVSFPFIARWADFAGPWRLRAGKTYLISVFNTDGSWIGAVNGETELRTKKRILGRTRAAEIPAVNLADDCQVYTGAITEAETELTFSTAGLNTGKSVLCFDLILEIEAETAEIAFPVSGWMDFCYPARGFKRGEKHALTFISLDGGTNWIGRWNNYLK